MRTKQVKSTAPGPESKVLIGLLPLCAVLAIIVLQSPTASSQAQFAHAGFQAAWERTDGPVASGAVGRGWIWGPVPGRALSESFAGLPGNSHLVQYFDKGRMELNNPNGDPKDPFFVTNGLLDVELISGLMQTGLTSFESRAPAAINLASDADDPSAPTYQSFNGVANIQGAPNERRKTARVGEVVRDAIDRQGVTQPWPQDHGDYGVRIAYFEPATGHNIPDVFWDFLNQQTQIVQDGQLVNGPLFYPWMSGTGYPISESYWSYVKVDGKYTDVLIQAYERRVLTFVPHLPSPFKVQMGNIGVHYYEWRYTSPAPGPTRPPVATPTSPVLPPKANITIDEIAYRKSITDLNGDYATLTNRGQTPQSLNGWWLDSPKWDHVDRFYFPNGITTQPGTSIRVHSGPGNDTSTDIYMFRTTIMWDQQPYDLAVLYDNYGREVTRFFPAAEVGQPTPPPVATPPAAGTVPPSKETPPATGPTATPVPGAPTATTNIPSPNPSAPVALTATPTWTATPGSGSNNTPTRTVTATATSAP
jgi:hypothetical protein